MTARVRCLEETFDVELFLRSGNTTKTYGSGRDAFWDYPNVVWMPTVGDRPPPKWETGQIGVQKLRIGAANPNAIMPMVKRLKDRLSRCRIFPHHRTARGIFAPADQFRNRRGRICPPANGPVVRNRLPPAFAGRCRRGVRSPLGRSRKLHYGRVERTANNFAESGSTTRQAFETAAHCADIDFRTEMEINNCEAIREAVVLGLGISVGAETEIGLYRQLR